MDLFFRYSLLWTLAETASTRYEIISFITRSWGRGECVMTALSYVDGEVTSAKSVGPMIVAHVCNEVGIWIGKNAKTIARQWPEVRFAYYRWYRNRIRNDFASGAVQFVDQSQQNLQLKIRVANLIAQPNHRRAIGYWAFEKCLLAVALKARKIGATVHLSKIGIDQTQNWLYLEDMISRILSDNGIRVFIYVAFKPVNRRVDSGFQKNENCD